MTTLEFWEKRPTEEANLFNPAFMASLIFEFAKAFQKGKPDGVPLTYIPVALAITLHRPSRMRLPYSTVTSLYEWVQLNEDILIGLSERIGGLLPYIKEAISFALCQETLCFGEGHLLEVTTKKAHFSSKFMENTTPEVSETIIKSQFMARWFLKSGSESSILACWGVRP